MSERVSSAHWTGRIARHYILAIGGAVLVALAIRFFLVEAYRIPSSAMKPTLEPGDTIFVAKWPFGFWLPSSSKPLTQGRLPRRGEVVVLSLPGAPSVDYIKRVIALPGDEITVIKGQAILNGKRLSVSAKATVVCGQERVDSTTFDVCWEPPLIDDVPTVRVPPGQVFVMGDLRSKTSSATSSFFKNGAEEKKTWGLIGVSNLKGKALCTWLSIEPPSVADTGWFSRIRLERMFKVIR